MAPVGVDRFREFTVIPGQAAAPAILIISFSDVSREPRVLRQIAALKGKRAITVAGRGHIQDADVESIDISSQWLHSVITRAIAGLLLVIRHEAAFQWMTRTSRHRLRRAVLRREFEAVIANEAECLPAAIDDICGQPKIVFDAHEIKEEQFSERVLWRLLVRPTVRRMLSRRLSSVSEITTVCDGIADILRVRYDREARIVMNARPYEALTPREPSRHRVHLVHSGGFSATRGLQTLVETLRMLDERFTLDFYLVEGSGLDAFRDQCADESRVRFHPPVAMSVLSSVMNQYDLGIYSLPPTSLNHALALPNKFFEFIQARVGLAIGPSVEMAKLVRQFDCGVISDDFSAAAMARVLRPLSTEDIFRMKQGADKAAKALNAETFEGVIRDTAHTS